MLQNLAGEAVQLSLAVPEQRPDTACYKLFVRRPGRRVSSRHGRLPAHTRAAVRIEGDDGELRVVVEDEGPGIPEAALERVFEPFVRLEASRSRDTGGSGLGLAIARGIVRGHGGDIVLANRAEGGLRATVALPGAGGA